MQVNTTKLSEILHKLSKLLELIILRIVDSLDAAQIKTRKLWDFLYVIKICSTWNLP
jgi:hypothetical protein